MSRPTIDHSDGPTARMVHVSTVLEPRNIQDALVYMVPEKTPPSQTHFGGCLGKVCSTSQNRGEHIMNIKMYYAITNCVDDDVSVKFDQIFELFALVNEQTQVEVAETGLYGQITQIHNNTATVKFKDANKKLKVGKFHLGQLRVPPVDMVDICAETKRSRSVSPGFARRNRLRSGSPRFAQRNRLRSGSPGY